MSSDQIVWCSVCKTNTATTFVQATLEIIGPEKYRVKCLNLALCDVCAALADLVTDTGKHLAEVLVGGAQ